MSQALREQNSTGAAYRITPEVRQKTALELLMDKAAKLIAAGCGKGFYGEMIIAMKFQDGVPNLMESTLTDQTKIKSEF